jgi:cytochrome c553
MRPFAKIFLASTAVWIGVACTAPPPPAPPQAPQPTPVERGKHLVEVSGCNDCHTPWKMGPNGPEPDMTRMLSGHPEAMKLTKPPKLDGSWMAATSTTFTAWVGPWGVSFTANLTSDKNTGLGADVWSEELFIKAIREGKHYGTARPILPPMPWQVYRNYSDDDLKAIFAYLRSTPPVANHVPDPIPPDQVAKMK